MSVMCLEDWASLYSDMHKEVYGRRPRFNWQSWTVEQFEAECDSLAEQAKLVREAEAEAEQLAISMFEDKVSSLIKHGAADRKAAIRWMLQSVPAECNVAGKRLELEYEWGLPHGYLNRS